MPGLFCAGCQDHPGAVALLRSVILSRHHVKDQGMAPQIRQDVVPQLRSFPQGRQHIGHHLMPAHVFVLRQPPPLIRRHLQPKHLPGGQHRGGHIRGHEVLHDCLRAACHRVIALSPGHLRALRRDRDAVQGKPLELAAGNRAHIAAGAGLQGKAVNDPQKVPSTRSSRPPVSRSSWRAPSGTDRVKLPGDQCRSISVTSVAARTNPSGRKVGASTVGGS